MNKRLCVYTIILAILLVVSLFVSKNDHKDYVKWFDFGKKKIVSLKYESNNLEINIVEQDRDISKQRSKDLKYLKNKGVYFVKYSTKNVDPNNKKSNKEDPLLLQCNYELNNYLELYSPFLVEKSFETEDLENFGINESSPKIIINFEGGITKTLEVGKNTYNNLNTYYYDPEKKSVVIHDATLNEFLVDALKTLVSYQFSDTNSQDISYMKVLSSSGEKTIYKVSSIKDSKELPSWSFTPQGEGNDAIVEWIGQLVLIKVRNYLDIEDSDIEKVMSVSMFSDKDKNIDSIEIAKYKDGYVGRTNYTGSWVSIDKKEVENILNKFNSL